MFEICYGSEETMQGICHSEQDAQIFKRTRRDMQMLIGRIPSFYGAEFIIL